MPFKELNTVRTHHFQDISKLSISAHAKTKQNIKPAPAIVLLLFSILSVCFLYRNILCLLNIRFTSETHLQLKSPHLVDRLEVLQRPRALLTITKRSGEK